MTGVRLSPRESEVAQLVREGLSNREIAKRLFISERTVEGHVQQVLNKLGFESRAQIAAWVAAGGAVRSTSPTEPVRKLLTTPRRRARLRWLLVPAAFVALVALVTGVLTLGRTSPGAGMRSVSVIASSGPYGGFAVAPDGTLYVGGSQVVRINAIGGVEAFAGTGQQGFAGDGGDARLAQLWGAGLVAVGPQGDVYISDQVNRRIRVVSREGVINTVAGNPDGMSGDGIPAVDAFLTPKFMAVTPAGDIYFNEPYRIRRIERATGLLTTFAGIGTPG